MSLDMNLEIRAQWCAALRSGDYQQAKEELRSEGNDPSYCCLGVLTDLYIKAGHSEQVNDPMYDPVYDDGPLRISVWEHPDNILSPEVADWAGLSTCDPPLQTGDRAWKTQPASHVNDDGVSFAAIADLIDGGAS